MTIRTVLADDQVLVRAGIAMLLSVTGDIEVVGEAGDGTEAVQLTRQLTPDVVVMDLRMPNLSGVAATQQLTADDFTGGTVKVLALTTFHADDLVFQALRAGASGFLLKDSAPDNLVTAIRAIAAGDAYLDPAVTRGIIADLMARPAPASALADRLTRLTTRETEILRLMAHGLSNVEIASRLVVAETTVKTHVCRVIMKLEARDRTQAVVLAYHAGLVSPGRG